MAKNGPNDLIFGKLVISNDFKRPIEVFFENFDFWPFFRIFWAKIAVFGPKMRKNGQKSKFSKIPNQIS